MLSTTEISNQKLAQLDELTNNQSMINIISHHPYIFSTIAILFLIGVIIMVNEVRRAIKVSDDYEED